MTRTTSLRLAVAGAAALSLATATVGFDALAQGSSYLTSARSRLLQQHNVKRKQHHAPPLSRNANLERASQEWAKRLASSGRLEHSTGNYGENLYESLTTGTMDAVELADAAIKGWYNEVAKYDFGQPGFSPATGHFTQMVWKSTVSMGCGVAQGTKRIGSTRFNSYYVVCRYSPPGNVVGQFPKNVLPR